MERATEPPADRMTTESTVLKVLIALSFSHLLNDMIQALLPALYPLFKVEFSLNFTQVGLITLAFQITASLLQPLVGTYTDRRPRPYSLAIGMGCTLTGLIGLALAPRYAMVVLSAALIGVGSSIFHPEASRLAKLASGGKHGFAQSVFQVGGNLGSSLGPLLAAAVVVPRGQRQILWFSLAALTGIAILTKVGGWYERRLRKSPGLLRTSGFIRHPTLSRRRVVLSVAILLALIFSKYFYLSSFSTYYTFYLINKFHLSVQSAQICLFVFLFSVAAGTFVGGPIGDRFGRKVVIWVSILGVAPFSLVLPHVTLAWTIVLTIPIGFILASAFSAILVFAQELIPGRTGLVAGLFFGFAFGMGGIGSAILGKLADHTSIDFVYYLCGFLPLIGLLTGFLPNLDVPTSEARERKLIRPV